MTKFVEWICRVLSSCGGFVAENRVTYCLYGAGERSRTPDKLITSQLLYQLSYTGDKNLPRTGRPLY